MHPPWIFNRDIYIGRVPKGHCHPVEGFFEEKSATDLHYCPKQRFQYVLIHPTHEPLLVFYRYHSTYQYLQQPIWPTGSYRHIPRLWPKCTFLIITACLISNSSHWLWLLWNSWSTHVGLSVLPFCNDTGRSIFDWLWWGSGSKWRRVEGIARLAVAALFRPSKVAAGGNPSLKFKFIALAEMVEGIILKLLVPATLLLFPLLRWEESAPVAAVKLFILPLIVNIVVVVVGVLDIDIVDIADPGLGLGLGGPPMSSRCWYLLSWHSCWPHMLFDVNYRLVGHRCCCYGHHWSYFDVIEFW